MRDDNSERTKYDRPVLITATVSELRRRYECRPIRDCPGRYVLVGGCRAHRDFLRSDGPTRFEGCASDPVEVVELLDGGLIGYDKGDGSFLHTLCDSDGFARKLAQLGIRLDD